MTSILNTKADLAAALKDLGIDMTPSQIKKASKDELAARYWTMIEQAAKQEKPKAPKTPRAMKPHTYCRPVEKAEDAKALTSGSKKHLIAAALLDGAALDELMTVSGWSKATVQSSFSYDMKNSGFGVERREDGKYYLILPAGMKALPVATADVSRADALVAACR